ncbi:MAG: Crp/Fnr family transcriptional regulator [Pseudomonadota bacterium]
MGLCMNIAIDIKRPEFLDQCEAKIGKLFHTRGTPITLRPDAVLFLDGDPLDTIFEVRRGVLRCLNVSEDGRKHIFKFSCEKSYVGVDFDERWRFTAESVNEVRLRALPRSVFLRAIAEDPALATWRMSHIQEQLRDREQQLLAFASRGADARLLNFLAGFARVAGTDLRRAGGATALPMSRRDIADHLGISFETVSRAFSALKRRGALEMIGPGVFRLPVLPHAAVSPFAEVEVT